MKTKRPDVDPCDEIAPSHRFDPRQLNAMIARSK
jgi:hypothetical protein